jgi:hypothetical protein
LTLIRELAGPILIAFGIFGEILFEHFATNRKDLEIERLRLQTEQERHARMKIEEQIADRWLSDEQTERVVEPLKPFAGQMFTLTVPFISREP